MQDQAERLYDALADAPGPIHLLDARSTSFTNGVMIATAHLAKGLAFNEVIAPFASDANYHADPDRHMLYVACTRAMHRLTLTCTVEASGLLADAVDQQIIEPHPAAA